MCKDLSVDNKNCSIDLVNMNTVHAVVASAVAAPFPLSPAKQMFKWGVKF